MFQKISKTNPATAAYSTFNAAFKDFFVALDTILPRTEDANQINLSATNYTNTATTTPPYYISMDYAMYDLGDDLLLKVEILACTTYWVNTTITSAHTHLNIRITLGQGSDGNGGLTTTLFSCLHDEVRGQSSDSVGGRGDVINHIVNISEDFKNLTLVTSAGRSAISYTAPGGWIKILSFINIETPIDQNGMQINNARIIRGTNRGFLAYTNRVIQENMETDPLFSDMVIEKIDGVWVITKQASNSNSVLHDDGMYYSDTDFVIHVQRTLNPPVNRFIYGSKEFVLVPFLPMPDNFPIFEVDLEDGNPPKKFFLLKFDSKSSRWRGTNVLTRHGLAFAYYG